ncbi:SET domain-containing protein-lysine N-methyltransferase [Pedobacter sp. LMG 31464]|uniref:SET domain-containing protein-lysine N-methyltransferase n=1 Tax=Pedobacter planticolens TaxID=2679964 RepID=A0A923DWP2_9SPHI|nr:SET domain-containing protein-lysine N-methyltransferase [Pedobacter planticolens]MBB2144475.1 SET domain-containing protein-lysine N-methyltransferase [Pedobacter planticolens]
MKKRLYLKPIKGKGRGVFCNTDISEGEVIEVCPVIIIPAEEFSGLSATPLMDYSFYFNKEENTLSLTMGFGSMYNHQQYPNAVYLLNREDRQMVFTAHENIKANTEICINYGGDYGIDYSKWFADRDIKIILFND